MTSYRLWAGWWKSVRRKEWRLVSTAIGLSYRLSLGKSFAASGVSKIGTCTSGSWRGKKSCWISLLAETMVFMERQRSVRKQEW
jgi:hypothetical protein